MRVITDYYRSYPSDRYVPIFKVLEGLSDARNLTIQRMHEYYGTERTPYRGSKSPVDSKSVVPSTGTTVH